MNWLILSVVIATTLLHIRAHTVNLTSLRKLCRLNLNCRTVSAVCSVPRGTLLEAFTGRLGVSGSPRLLLPHVIVTDFPSTRKAAKPLNLAALRKTESKDRVFVN
jgi:hypothetical protein